MDDSPSLVVVSMQVIPADCSITVVESRLTSIKNAG
jgi:hypothetical protein